MIFHVTKNDIKLASNSVRWSQTECVIGRTIGRKIPTASRRSGAQDGHYDNTRVLPEAEL